MRGWIVYIILTAVWVFGYYPEALGQTLENDIKVYDYDDGLPHRNVFDLLQDESGFMWMATLEGVVRFDGYDFLRVEQAGASISHLALAGDQLYCAGLDSIVHLDLSDGSTGVLRLKDGAYQRRQSTRPTQMVAAGGRIYAVVQEELTGQIQLMCLEADGRRTVTRTLPGQYLRRPLAARGDSLWFAELDNQLLRIDLTSGQLLQSDAIRPRAGAPAERIVDLKVDHERLWALTDQGHIFHRKIGQDNWTLMSTSPAVEAGYQGWQCLELGPQGDLYVGGRGELWHFDHYQQEWLALDPAIRRIMHNTPTYRRLLYDASGALWAATDFGAVRINRQRRFFHQYLTGGSDLCSNFYCSIRGMAEDEQGRIYISYYNAIHRLDPETDELEPLFPAGDFFNYPFDLAYHDGHLYTGNGIKIRLTDLNKQSLFGADDDEGEGSVALTDDGRIWFGFRDRLHWHDPATGENGRYLGPDSAWADLAVSSIACLVPDHDALWIGTKEDGLYELNLANNRILHWSAEDLPSGQVNAIYRRGGVVWAATANGLARISLADGKVKTYTREHGLPHNYLNGILPEGDSALWLSTDHGLSRFSPNDRQFKNFLDVDGLSANEFNRSSYLRARDGRLYFGGLDGVNAFHPSLEMLEFKDRREQVPLNLTQLSYIDGTNDSVHQLDFAQVDDINQLDLGYQNRQFVFDVSLADYREPQDNRYSYWIENLTKDWSEPAPDRRLRVPDLPPGEYRLHVRARSSRGEWVEDVIDLPIRIRRPYYYNIWFWAALIGAVSFGFVLLYRFRAKAAIRRQQELEREVAQRTTELAAEKHKSDQLLLNILPTETAEELKQTGKARARRYEQVTVFFSDFAGFTAISNQMEPEDLVKELDFCFRTFDEIVARYQLEKIKTIGDAYLFVGGLDGDAEQGAVNSLKAARDIQTFLRTYAEECREAGRPVFRARVGLHTGPLVTGVVGTHKFAYDIWGESVNIASRMESNGEIDGIVVSSATQELVGTQFDCRPYGLYEEHGKQVEMYLVG